MHIIIRYEIEKELINGDLSCEEIPSLWNQKYKDYLGVEPLSPKEGMLQDVHWSCGAIGYFPSYALGHMISSQFENTMYKQGINLDKLIKEKILQQY